MITAEKVNPVSRNGARFYPCPLCYKDHPSSTTLLDMIANKAFIGWAAKNGTAKLLEYEKVIVEMNPVVAEGARGRFEASFWKSGYEQAKDAADYGTTAHAAFEMHLKGIEPDLKALPEPSRNAFESFRNFWKEHHVEVIGTERTFYNCSMNYAGTCDAILKVDGELTLWDWKTSNGIFSSYPIQVFSYALADEMQNSDRLYRQVGIGRFGKDGSAEVKIYRRNDFPGIEDARKIMMACEVLFQFKQKYDIAFPWKKNGKSE